MNERTENWDDLDRHMEMVGGIECEIPSDVREAFCYLQSWGIYMWGEPNESSLLFVNSR